MKKLFVLLIFIILAVQLQAQVGVAKKSSASNYDKYTRVEFGDTSAAFFYIIGTDTTVNGSRMLKLLMMNSAEAGNATAGKQDTAESTLNSIENFVRRSYGSTLTVSGTLTSTYTQIASNTCKKIVFFNHSDQNAYVSINDASPTDDESEIVPPGSYRRWYKTNTNLLRVKGAGSYKITYEN